jgi:hypothetical protein
MKGVKSAFSFWPGFEMKWMNGTARPLHIEYPAPLYHIVNRALSRENITRLWNEKIYA